MRYEQKSFDFNRWALRVLCVRDEKNVNKIWSRENCFAPLKGQTETT
jgi:hypothetical protein